MSFSMAEFTTSMRLCSMVTSISWVMAPEAVADATPLRPSKAGTSSSVT